MAAYSLHMLLVLVLYTVTAHAAPLQDIYAKESSPRGEDVYSEQGVGDEGPSKKAPWQSYQWEEEKEKRPYGESSHMDPLGRDAPWASIDFDKKAPWASYDLRSKDLMVPHKRDPWAYPKLNSLWSYISRRGRGRFVKPSNKRTRNSFLSDDLEQAEVKDKRALYSVPDRKNMVERLLSISQHPSKRDTRSLEQTLLDIASKRRLGRVREPSDVHPVNMGLGQHAAGYALDTYSRLLADEHRRLQEGAGGGRPGGAPVRFIGK